jgi:four helix bundle protein
MTINSYKDLQVWKIAKSIAIVIYKVTADFPNTEVFGLTNQLRRASISISNNIAEGTGRQYKKDTLQFLYVSNGSLNEVESMITIAQELNYINNDNMKMITLQIEECRKLLKGFISYYKNNNNLK